MMCVLHTEGYYFLMDCPGQVELFTLHDSLLAILGALDKQSHFRCAACTQRAPAVPLPNRAKAVTHANKYLEGLGQAPVFLVGLEPWVLSDRQVQVQ